MSSSKTPSPHPKGKSMTKSTQSRRQSGKDEQIDDVLEESPNLDSTEWKTAKLLAAKMLKAADLDDSTRYDKLSVDQVALRIISLSKQKDVPELRDEFQNISGILTKTQLSVVMLRIWGDRTFEEISEALTISKQTAHTHFKRACKKFFAEFKKRYESDQLSHQLKKKLMRVFRSPVSAGPGRF